MTSKGAYNGDALSATLKEIERGGMKQNYSREMTLMGLRDMWLDDEAVDVGFVSLIRGESFPFSENLGHFSFKIRSSFVLNFKFCSVLFVRFFPKKPDFAHFAFDR